MSDRSSIPWSASTCANSRGLRTLPVAQARELREQIVAHLDEALPPGATTEEVRRNSARLGSPRRSPPTRRARAGGRSLRRLRNRLGPRPLVGLGGARRARRADRLRPDLYASRAQREPLSRVCLRLVLPAGPGARGRTQAGVTTQFTVPERSGQQQGIVINIVNNSDWTQTVLGVDPHCSPFSSPSVQVAIGSGK